MTRLRSFLLVLVTAVVTAAFTSMVWIYLYNRAGEQPAAEQDQPATQEAMRLPAATPSPSPILSSGLIIPVEGVKPGDLMDTWSQARGGGSRTHDAIDIIAPRGAKVVAAASGIVEKIHESVPGGHTVYVRTTAGDWVHYYAHLDSYAPGLVEGQKVGQGQLLGFVGSTGNADPAAPHLHFAMQQMKPGERWYQGTAVNPFPYLQTSGSRRN